MAGDADKTPASTGVLPSEEVDVDALFARLQQEVRRGGAAPADGNARVAWRGQAERLWAVSAERPIRRRPGARGFVAYGVKKALRPFLRWYVEPLAAEQRGYNDALLKLFDELCERAERAAAGEEAARRSVAELEERLLRVERRPRPEGIVPAAPRTVAARKLRPGGLLVAETINPLSPLALRSYFADLTHSQPLVPETLALLAGQAGFREVETRFLNEPAERLALPDDPVIAANVRRLNEMLFAPLDYAILART